jgi:hypothetical protein
LLQSASVLALAKVVCELVATRLLGREPDHVITHAIRCDPRPLHHRPLRLTALLQCRVQPGRCQHARLLGRPRIAALGYVHALAPQTRADRCAAADTELRAGLRRLLAAVADSEHILGLPGIVRRGPVRGDR